MTVSETTGTVLTVNPVAANTAAPASKPPKKQTASKPPASKTAAKSTAKPSAKSSASKANKSAAKPPAAKKPPVSKPDTKTQWPAKEKSLSETAVLETALTLFEMSERLEAATAYIQNEVLNACQSFLRIGFKLWQIREDKLYLSGNYGSVVEYAERVFKLQQSSVYNYIAVCERFSEQVDGNPTERLDVKYSGFAYGQLTLMLPLPDEKVKELKPDLTCKEIREIKKSVATGSGEKDKPVTSDTGKSSENSPAKHPQLQEVYSVYLTETNLPAAISMLKEHIGYSIKISVFK